MRRLLFKRPFASLRMTSLVAVSLAACQASTSRPTFGPVTGAQIVVLELDVPRATNLVATGLRADSFPVTVLVPRDGYLETPWFDSATTRPTSKYPVGRDVVRVRAWVDPEKPGHSKVTVETLFRDVVDPSLPERELDREVPPDHPTSVRVRAVLDSLRKRYGEPDRPE